MDGRAGIAGNGPDDGEHQCLKNKIMDPGKNARVFLSGPVTAVVSSMLMTSQKCLLPIERRKIWDAGGIWAEKTGSP